MPKQLKLLHLAMLPFIRNATDYYYATLRLKKLIRNNVYETIAHF